MWKRIVLLVPLLAAGLAPARDSEENWLEVRSQHFTVVTNANEKTGRRIADQFERMRSVFHLGFPHMPIDNGNSIIVLAVKDAKDFRALEPPEYLAKGQLKLGGLFLHAQDTNHASDTNYVLMRLDAEGEHPYGVVYHEYTHFLLSKAEWLPLWLNEGLAVFYENTDISGNDIAVGQPSAGWLALLRDTQLLPLATLFTVDTSSPYYHEENKGNIFYAESWALTHYLFVKDARERTQRLADYAELVAKKMDPMTAATRSFGDLKQLQSNLDAHIRLGRFDYFKLSASVDVDATPIKTQPLSEAQADAVRADFLAYNGRVADARLLLDRVLQADPQNVSAHETMGRLELQAGHLEEARKWCEQAVKLDSQNYLAHYYLAEISTKLWTNPGDDALVESSLRAAIKLNPSFAGAFDGLAAFEVKRHRDLDEAYMMALTAVQLDQGNVGYRVTAASVLMQMDRGTDAVAVLRGALRVAKTPWETAMIKNYLTYAEQHVNAGDRQAEGLKANVQAAASAGEGSANAETSEEELPKGPRRFTVGTLQDVHCHGQGIELTVVAKGQTMALHRGNYHKIELTVLGFTPIADLSPCRDLEGIRAKVEYVESTPPLRPTAYVVAIELHK